MREVVVLWSSSFRESAFRHGGATVDILPSSVDERLLASVALGNETQTLSVCFF
jgi:hypothetical protein